MSSYNNITTLFTTILVNLFHFIQSLNSFQNLKFSEAPLVIHIDLSYAIYYFIFQTYLTNNSPQSTLPVTSVICFIYLFHKFHVTHQTIGDAPNHLSNPSKP